MSTPTSEIKRLLEQVGMREDGASSELVPGIEASIFDSDYARLYIVNCARIEKLDWPETVRQVDRKILHDLRSRELSGGGVVDAHVCFIVVDDTDPMAWAAKNEQLVRQVSRKYWIKSSMEQEELACRLTILPINTTPLQQGSRAGLPSDSGKWLDDLVTDGVSATVEKFIATLETSRQ